MLLDVLSINNDREEGHHDQCMPLIWLINYVCLSNLYRKFPATAAHLLHLRFLFFSLLTQIYADFLAIVSMNHNVEYRLR